jgi:hypothetical protein
MREGVPNLSGHVAAPERGAGGSPPMSGREEGGVPEVSPGTDVGGYVRPNAFSRERMEGRPQRTRGYAQKGVSGIGHDLPGRCSDRFPGR